MPDSDGSLKGAAHADFAVQEVACQACISGHGVRRRIVLSVTVAYAAYTDNLIPNSSWMESPIDTTTGVDSRAEEQINVTMADYNRNTDLTTFYDSTPVFSGAGETDVIYRHKTQDFRDSATVGYYFCDDVAGLSSSNKCDQGYINLRYITNTPAQMRALAYHETGHAFGLLHPDDSSPSKSTTDTRFECMMNAPMAAYYGIGWDPNVANINSTYPN